MTTTPATIFELARGEAATFKVRVTNPDGTFPDLSGLKLWCTIKARLEDTSYLIRKRTQAAGGSSAEFEIPTQTGTALGTALVHFVRADTVNLKPGAVYWVDLWYLPTGQTDPVQVVEPGYFSITYSVTTAF